MYYVKGMQLITYTKGTNTSPSYYLELCFRALLQH